MTTAIPCVTARSAAIFSLSLALLVGTVLATPREDKGVPQSVAIIDGQETAVPSIAMGDADSIAIILKEAKENSKVMEHLTHLTKQIGHRLTGSTACDTANRWIVSQYESWGIANPHVEEWGTVATRFDRGPSVMKLVIKSAPPARPRGEGAEGAAPAENASPSYTTLRELQFTTLAWTRGTSGVVRGPVVWMPETEAEYADLVKAGKLKGAWVLVKAPPPAGRRGVQEGMSNGFSQRLEARKQLVAGDKGEEGGKKIGELPLRQRIAIDPEAGIAGFISATRGETVLTSGAPGWRERAVDDIPQDIAVIVRRSDYDAINSRVADGEAVEIEADLQHTLAAGPHPVYNTIGEIRGSEKPEEVVIVSAHLDSWNGPGSEGCTDNGTGSSVVMEAARILAGAIKNGAKAPKRTIRFIHWTGEEQGLLGSKEYIAKRKEQLLETVSACFVDDGGTNYQGGLPAHPVQVDYLAAATAPVNNQFYCEVDKKHLNVNIRKSTARVGGSGGGSSDHASFNRVGIPGFFWDEVGRADYGFGWHTQNDKLDLAIPVYLQQSSACMAITAYNLACAPELLPRPSDKKEEAPKPVDTKPVEGQPAEKPVESKAG